MLLTSFLVNHYINLNCSYEYLWNIYRFLKDWYMNEYPVINEGNSNKFISCRPYFIDFPLNKVKFKLQVISVILKKEFELVQIRKYIQVYRFMKNFWIIAHVSSFN